jgi:hypothetical protein
MKNPNLMMKFINQISAILNNDIIEYYIDTFADIDYDNELRNDYDSLADLFKIKYIASVIDLYENDQFLLNEGPWTDKSVIEDMVQNYFIHE